MRILKSRLDQCGSIKSEMIVSSSLFIVNILSCIRFVRSLRFQPTKHFAAPISKSRECIGTDL